MEKRSLDDYYALDGEEDTVISPEPVEPAPAPAPKAKRSLDDYYALPERKAKVTPEAGVKEEPDLPAYLRVPKKKVSEADKPGPFMRGFVTAAASIPGDTAAGGGVLGRITGATTRGTGVDAWLESVSDTSPDAYKPETGELSDLWNNPYDFVMESLGQGVGSTALTVGPLVAGAGVGAAGGATVGGLPGAGAGAIAGAAIGKTWGPIAPIYLQSVGGSLKSMRQDKEIKQALKEGKITPDQLDQIAAIAGAGIGTVEYAQQTLTPGIKMAPGVRTALDAMTKRLQRRLVGRMIATGGEMGAEEAVQEVIQEIGNYYAGSTEGADGEKIATSFLQGAIPGFFMGVFGKRKTVDSDEDVEDTLDPDPKTSSEQATPQGPDEGPEGGGQETGQPTPSGGQAATPATLPATTPDTTTAAPAPVKRGRRAKPVVTPTEGVDIDAGATMTVPEDQWDLGGEGLFDPAPPVDPDLEAVATPPTPEPLGTAVAQKKRARRTPKTGNVVEDTIAEVQAEAAAIPPPPPMPAPAPVVPPTPDRIVTPFGAEPGGVALEQAEPPQPSQPVPEAAAAPASGLPEAAAAAPEVTSSSYSPEALQFTDELQQRRPELFEPGAPLYGEEDWDSDLNQPITPPGTPAVAEPVTVAAPSYTEPTKAAKAKAVGKKRAAKKAAPAAEVTEAGRLTLPKLPKPGKLPKLPKLPTAPEPAAKKEPPKAKQAKAVAKKAKPKKEEPAKAKKAKAISKKIKERVAAEPVEPAPLQGLETAPVEEKMPPPAPAEKTISPEEHAKRRKEALEAEAKERKRQELAQELTRVKGNKRSRVNAVRAAVRHRLAVRLRKHFQGSTRFEAPGNRDIRDAIDRAVNELRNEIDDRRKNKSISDVVRNMSDQIGKVAERHADDIAAERQQETQAEPQAKEAREAIARSEERTAEARKKLTEGTGQEVERATKVKGISPEGLMRMGEKALFRYAKKNPTNEHAKNILEFQAAREKAKGAGAANRATQATMTAAIQAEKKAWARDMKAETPKAPKKKVARVEPVDTETAITTLQKRLAMTPEQVAEQEAEKESKQAAARRAEKMPSHTAATEQALKDNPSDYSAKTGITDFPRTQRAGLEMLYNQLKKFTGKVNTVNAGNTPAENFVALYRKNAQGLKVGSSEATGNMVFARYLLEHDPDSLYDWYKSDPGDASFTSLDTITDKKEAELIQRTLGGNVLSAQRPGTRTPPPTRGTTVAIDVDEGLVNLRTGQVLEVDKSDITTLGKLLPSLDLSDASTYGSWNFIDWRRDAQLLDDQGSSLLDTLSDLIDERIKERLSDVPVYLLTQDQIRQLRGNPANTTIDGFYVNPTTAQRAEGVHGIIVIDKALVDKAKAGDAGMLSYIVRHESVHALTHAFITYDKTGSVRVLTEIARMFKTAHPEMADPRSPKYQYGLKDLHEFVTEAFTNPAFQQALADMDLPIHLEKLVKSLTRAKNPQSMWDAFVAIIGRIMGFHNMGRPGLMSVLEATIKLVEEGMGDVNMATLRAAELARTVPAHELAKDFSSIQPIKGGDWSRHDAATFSPVQSSMERHTHGVKAMSDAVAQEAFRKLDESKDAGTNFTAAGRKLLDNFTTLEQLGQQAKKLLKDLPGAEAVETLIRAAQVKNTQANRFKLEGLAIADELHRLRKKSPKVAEKVSEIAHNATIGNYDPTVGLDHKNNKHIAKADPKKPTKGILDAHQRAAHAEAQAEIAKLPEHAQALLSRMSQHFTQENETHVSLLIKNIVEGTNKESPLTLPPGETLESLMDWVKDGGINRRPDDKKNPTPQDVRDEQMRNSVPHELLRTLEVLNRARKASFYVPLARHGDTVINAVKTYATPEGAVKGQREGEFLFIDENAFKKFMEENKNEPLAAQPQSRWMIRRKDKSGKLGPLEKGDPKEAGSKRVYSVRMQTQLMETFESLAEANKRHAELKADPRFKDVKAPVERKALWQDVGNLPEGAIRTMAERATSYVRKNIKDPTAAKHWENAFVHILMQNSTMTRMQQKRQPRRKVLGFSNDLERSVRDAATSMGAHRANLEMKPAITDSLKTLDEAVESMRSGRYTNNEANRLSHVVGAIRNNLTASDSYDPSAGMSRAANTMMTFSFLKNLVSPAYHIINSLQPLMTALPHLMRDNSLGTSVGALTRAYRTIRPDSIWAAAGRGTIEETKRAFGGRQRQAGDMMDKLRERLGSDKEYGEGLVATMNELQDRGHLLDNPGAFEFDPTDIANKNDLFSVAERAMHKVARVAREFAVGTEVINRAATLHAVYTTSRERGMTHEAAMRATVDAVVKTQGDMSSTNAPTAFKKHAVLRVLTQYKKFPQMMTYNMATSAAEIFKGEKPEIRRAAAREFATLAATHALMAGAVGLPMMEGAKFFFWLSSFLFGNEPLDEYEDRLQKWLAGAVGATTSEAIMRGAPRLIGMNLSGRVGLDNLLFSGRMDTSTRDKFSRSVVDMVPSISNAADMYYGLVDGDWKKALPLKFLTDAAKAFEGTTTGTRDPKSGKVWQEPYGGLSAFWQAMGFQPAESARQWEPGGAGYERRQLEKAKTERTDMMGPWLNAISGAERKAAWDEIRAWNVGKEPSERITMSDLQKSKRSRERRERREKRAIQEAQ